MVGVPIGFYRMAEGIHACTGSDVLGQGIGQLWIDNRNGRIEDRGFQRCLDALGMVHQDGDTGYFTACPSGGRDGNQWQFTDRQGNLALKIEACRQCVEAECRSCFCTVDDTATAQSNHKVALFFADHV